MKGDKQQHKLQQVQNITSSPVYAHQSRAPLVSERTDQHSTTLPLPLLPTHTMEGWNKIQNSFTSINFGQSASKIAKGFNNSVQATRERLGQIAPEEITELPQGTWRIVVQ